MSLEQTDRNALLSDDQVEGVTSMLDNLAGSRELFGLRDVRFADLVVKGPIPTYRYVETGLEYVDGLYALCSNHGIIALLREGLGHQFFAFFDDGQALGSFLSGDDVSGIALVGDADGLYVSRNSGLTFLNERRIHPNDGFESIANDHSFESVSAAIHNNYQVSSQAIVYSEPLPDRSLPCENGYYYLPSVGFQIQHYSNSCWAACTAMIYNSYVGPTYDDEYFVNWLAIEYGDSPANERGSSDVKYCLNQKLYTNKFTVFQGHPTYSNAYACIENGVPFVAFLNKINLATWEPYPYVIGHAVTVLGYNPSNYYLCYWDPADDRQNPYPFSLNYYNNYGDIWYYTYLSPYGYLYRLEQTVYKNIWQ